MWRLLFILNSIAALGYSALQTTEPFPREATHVLQSLKDRIEKQISVISVQHEPTLKCWFVNHHVYANVVSCPKKLGSLVQKALHIIFENDLPLSDTLFGLPESPSTRKRKTKNSGE